MTTRDDLDQMNKAHRRAMVQSVSCTPKKVIDQINAEWDSIRKKLGVPFQGTLTRKMERRVIANIRRGLGPDAESYGEITLTSFEIKPCGTPRIEASIRPAFDPRTLEDPVN